MREKFDNRPDASRKAAHRLAPHWMALAAAPHRFFFFTGLFFMVLMSAWWLVVLLARQYLGASLEPVLPGIFMHGANMLFLVFPPFMFGFLLTVYPRWQPAPEIPRFLQALAFGLLHLGLPLILAGMYSTNHVLAAGWIVIAAAWLSIVAGLLWSWVKCRARVIHASVVVIGLLAGLLCVMAFAGMLLGNEFWMWPWIRSFGLWGFLLTVYMAVCHRMIPFFTSRVTPGYVAWRPDWMLWLFVGASFLRAALEPHPELRILPELVLFLVVATFAFRWWPRSFSGNAMLAVLHVSFAWLVFAAGLYVLQDVMQFVFDLQWLGRAPLHALGMGFFGGMLIAMITRVTMGHSGRPLVLDRKGWWIFMLLQAAVVFRVIAEVFPGFQPGLLSIAAGGWFIAFFAWGWRYGRIHFQPRVDGRPG